jgi:membrane fusion protein, multidrug efflux system
MEKEVEKKRSVKLLVIAGLLLAGIGVGIFHWIKSQAFETTDNAQLDCNIIPVRSVVTAYLRTVTFTDNETVKKGQVLFIFDTTELKAKADDAEASLKIARAKLLSAQNKASASSENAFASNLTSESYKQSILSSKANLDKAQSNYNRTAALYQIKAATKEQLETAETNVSVAKAEYIKAINVQKSSTSTSLGLKSLAKSEENQIMLAEAQVSQCEAQVLLAKCQLNYAIVHAPCNGIISKRTVQAGQYISTGQSLCALVDNEHLWVTANFKETQLKHIQIGEDVKIEMDAYPDLNLNGKIESFSGATGAKYALLPPDNSTGNFIKIAQRIPVKITIDNITNVNPKGLFPGLSVFVKVFKR